MHYSTQPTFLCHSQGLWDSSTKRLEHIQIRNRLWGLSLQFDKCSHQAGWEGSRETAACRQVQQHHGPDNPATAAQVSPRPKEEVVLMTCFVPRPSSFLRQRMRPNGLYTPFTGGLCTGMLKTQDFITRTITN